MSNDGKPYTHYVVLNEVILGEACVIEKVNEWMSLALVRLGIAGTKLSTCYAFVENRALVAKIEN
jgi:hypothetical protein